MTVHCVCCNEARRRWRMGCGASAQHGSSELQVEPLAESEVILYEELCEVRSVTSCGTVMSEPGKLRLLARWEATVITARLRHGINDDPDQVPPEDGPKSLAMKTVVRVRRWISQVCYTPDDSPVSDGANVLQQPTPNHPRFHCTQLEGKSFDAAELTDQLPQPVHPPLDDDIASDPRAIYLCAESLEFHLRHLRQRKLSAPQ